MIGGFWKRKLEAGKEVGIWHRIKVKRLNKG
jgi:hypothetical protein